MPQSTPHRATVHLHRLATRYPNAWRQFDDMRSQRGQRLPNWPDWCWCPLAGAFAVVSGGASLAAMGQSMLLQVASDVGPLGALAAWRVGQGIYRFDPDLRNTVLGTDLDRAVPWEILYRLPEWCVYIETPTTQYGGQPLYGFFAHLEHDDQTGRTELRLVLDLAGRLLPIPIHCVEGAGLLKGIEAAILEAKVQAAKVGAGWASVSTRTGGLPCDDLVALKGLVSLVLYLCSENPDIEGRPAKAMPIKTRRNGSRSFPPNAPSVWEVGLRIGAAIRAALASWDGANEGGSHATPRPHLRRAHWHTYWTGKTASPQDRKMVVKWLLPILVGTNPGESPAVVHPVPDYRTTPA